MAFPIPKGETERLRTLRAYKILDTKPEERFDDLTQLAAIVCDAPISLMTLIDSERQWFKSKIGLALEETPRADAFCTYAIMQPDLFVVPDASRDMRFSENPLVTGDPHIRFYAGAPLAATNGQMLGTLCVIDRVPRELRSDQVRALRILSRQMISQMELRNNLIELKSALRLRDECDSLNEEAAQVVDKVLAKLQSSLGDLNALRKGPLAHR